MDDTPEKALARRHIAAAIAAAGGGRAVATLLGISEQAVSQWRGRVKVPTEYVQPLCAAGGIVTAKQLLRVMLDAKLAQELAK